MEKVLHIGKLPVKLWLNEIEDGAPSAYKDIKEVMRNQSDQVEIIVVLTPMAVIKG